MTEEEKQELEALRQEKHQRTQTQRAETALAEAGVPATFAALLVGRDDADTAEKARQFCEAYRAALAEDVRQRLPQRPPVVTDPGSGSHREPRGVRLLK